MKKKLSLKICEFVLRVTLAIAYSRCRTPFEASCLNTFVEFENYVLNINRENQLKKRG